jgi:hypothetical protein
MYSFIRAQKLSTNLNNNKNKLQNEIKENKTKQKAEHLTTKLKG